MTIRARLLRFVLAIALAVSSNALKVEVHSAAEFAVALYNESVDHILMHGSETSGVWNITEHDFPFRGLHTRNRTVVLEGVHNTDGSLAYSDGNALRERMLVGPGSTVLMKNIFVDDCFSRKPPYSCFFYGTGGDILSHGVTLGDATCVNIRKSRGPMMMLRYYAHVATVPGGLIFKYSPDNRSLWMEDTGHFYMKNLGGMRFENFTLKCTGNVTHPLPPEGSKPRSKLPPALEVFTDDVTFWAAVALASVLLLQLVKAGPSADLRDSMQGVVEYRVALSKGWVLKRLLGEGHYGRVYIAAPREAPGDVTRQVALKVVDVSMQQRQQLIQAWKECQVMASVDHPSCVKILTFYSTQVENQPRRIRGLVDAGYHYSSWSGRVPRQAAGFVNALQRAGQSSGEADGSGSGSLAGQAPDVVISGREEEARRAALFRRTIKTGHATLPTLLPQGQQGRLPPLLEQGSGLSASPPPQPWWWRPWHAHRWSCSSSSSSSSGGSGDSARPSSIATQVHLVMQYCDQGTLLGAIKAGAFWDEQHCVPILHDIAATALEIALGLEYLHAPPRRMVHRDLSAANVLLTMADNSRGFKALVSDFGLTTALSAETVQRYSEIKGTLQYMPPEVFTEDNISSALDVYSFGVLLYMMCVGHGPFDGQTAAQMVLAKMRSSESEGQALDREKLRLPWGNAAPLQELLWDCTQYDWRARPTAAQCVERLKALLRDGALPLSAANAASPQPVMLAQPVNRIELLRSTYISSSSGGS